MRFRDPATMAAATGDAVCACMRRVCPSDADRSQFSTENYCTYLSETNDQCLQESCANPEAAEALANMVCDCGVDMFGDDDQFSLIVAQYCTGEGECYEAAKVWFDLTGLSSVITCGEWGAVCSLATGRDGRV